MSEIKISVKYSVGNLEVKLNKKIEKVGYLNIVLIITEIPVDRLNSLYTVIVAEVKGNENRVRSSRSSN